MNQWKPAGDNRIEWLKSNISSHFTETTNLVEAIKTYINGKFDNKLTSAIESRKRQNTEGNKAMCMFAAILNLVGYKGTGASGFANRTAWWMYHALKAHKLWVIKDTNYGKMWEDATEDFKNIKVKKK